MSPNGNILPGNTKDQSKTGSLKPGEPEFLEVGRLRRSHGVKGEMVLEIFSESLNFFKKGKQLFIGQHHQPFTIESTRSHDDLLLIKFEGIDTPEALTSFRNKLVYIPVSQLPPLPEGKYYFYQLIGLEAVDQQGRSLGLITEIIQTGSAPVYVVTSTDGNEQLFPAIPDVVKKIDIKTRKIIIQPQEWD
jgi:16S rRNA processing protein RimM